jgi:ATP/maltotriose-dependent transcriptional regulator MalT
VREWRVAAVPDLPPGYVPRGRLTAFLDHAVSFPLMLIAAPAAVL